ncbi:hypothetical protein D6T63_18470 [Arthrobacter cheniae]|uniref:Uncharacterized protein n=1 Tax=Arthrobacter cheniae TaxID=1258888 RepID=A0A3A5M902_9MICC|nr:hypothetical protein [Arthrobacter cheniae]RJT74897.1 hypothetical protein D6T63_18470 [Arthrobacter cheniae]
MTGNAHGGHVAKPNEGDASTSDSNRHSIGDQGKEQAKRAGRDPSAVAAAAEQEGHYTSTEAVEGSGGYTSAQDPVQEGEYTDKDKPVVDEPETEGGYTDRDR